MNGARLLRPIPLRNFSGFAKRLFSSGVDKVGETYRAI